MTNSDRRPSGPKKYPIQHPEIATFDTGRTREGEQVVIGVPGPYVVAAFFDAGGAILRHEVRQVSGTPSRAELRPEKPPKGLMPRLRDLVRDWQAEMGFTPSDVSVCQFSLPDLGFGIYDLPEFLRYALDDSKPHPDEDFRRECLDHLEEWRRLGKFTVLCGNEYWMSDSGEITDS